jgi:SAM-dependent MidA family methyltransferase
MGEADLTSHVNFDALKKAIKSDIKIFGTITQRNLLLACGIDIRLKSLQKNNPALSQILEKQYDRLVSEKQMGNLFKAIAIFSDEEIPIGFARESYLNI